MSAIALMFVLLCLGIAGTFIVLVVISAAFGLLPENAEAVIGKMLYEMSNSMVPSSTSMIKIDPICWYGRGNVLYQIGQMRDKEDLSDQRLQARKSMDAILKLASRLAVDVNI